MKEQYHFFVTCPECRHQFSVRPEVVMKYMDRFFTQLGKDLGKQKARKKDKKRKS